MSMNDENRKKHILTVLLRNALLVVPIIIFLLPIISSGRHTILPGDFDMQIQMTEAARITVAEYKQFPWFNPWVSGGVPLFADPQFGLFSAQTLFALILGSIVGWKLYIVLMFIAGFFGFVRLLQYVAKPNNKTSLLCLYALSYAWIMNSFFVFRSGGHLTFLLLLLLPWALYFYFSRTESKARGLLLIALLTYCVYSAVHYPTIIIFVTLCFFYTYDLLLLFIHKHKEKKYMIKKHLLYGIGTFGTVFLLSIPRLVFALEYLSRNSVKRTVYEKFIGVREIFVSIFTPPKLNLAQPTHYTWGAFEASAYSGFLLLIILIITLILLKRRAHRSINQLNALIIPLACLCIITIAIGSGGVLFSLMQKLPVFSSMRVSTRWFFVSLTCLIMLTYIAFNTYIKKIEGVKLKLLAVVTVFVFAEVFVFNGLLLHDVWNKNHLVVISNPAKNQQTTIEQEALWLPNGTDQMGDKTQRSYFALTQATIMNKGQVIADNALVDTRFIATARCDKDEPNCNFVISNNGQISFWSPNKIIVTRTAPGDISININSGKHWLINGKRVVVDSKVVDAVGTLTIPDSNEQIYTVQYNPIANL